MNNRKKNSTRAKPNEELVRTRLDKWLWSARFFRTRAQAKRAIEGGKVTYQKGKPKPSAEISPGVLLKISQGFNRKEVVVKALSEQRRGASAAALLYEETAHSIQAREEATQTRRLQRADWLAGNKPEKKERRQRMKLKYSDEG